MDEVRTSILKETRSSSSQMQFEQVREQLLAYGESLSPLIKRRKDSPGYESLSYPPSLRSKAYKPVCFMKGNQWPLKLHIQKDSIPYLPLNLRWIDDSEIKGDPHLRKFEVSPSNLEVSRLVIKAGVDLILEHEPKSPYLGSVKVLESEVEGDQQFQVDIETGIIEGGLDYEEAENQKFEPNDNPSKNSQSPQRNPNVALKALQLAAFKCELDTDHHTFVSKRTGKNFVEAHHLIPLAFQCHFTFNLDRTSNIVALCPNCHRMIHHGKSPSEAFRSLLDSRMDRLKSDRIQPTGRDWETIRAVLFELL